MGVGRESAARGRRPAMLAGPGPDAKPNAGPKVFPGQAKLTGYPNRARRAFTGRVPFNGQSPSALTTTRSRACRNRAR
jgi:hypothetical protein